MRHRANDVRAARTLEEVVIERIDRAVDIRACPGGVRCKNCARGVGISIQAAAEIRLIARDGAVGAFQCAHIVNAAAGVEAAAGHAVARDRAGGQSKIRDIVNASAVAAARAAPTGASDGAAAADGRAEERHTALAVQSRAVALSAVAGCAAVCRNAASAAHGEIVPKSAGRDLIRSANGTNRAAQTVAGAAGVPVHGAAALPAHGAVALK